MVRFYFWILFLLTARAVPLRRNLGLLCPRVCTLEYNPQCVEHPTLGLITGPNPCQLGAILCGKGIPHSETTYMSGTNCTEMYTQQRIEQYAKENGLSHIQ